MSGENGAFLKATRRKLQFIAKKNPTSFFKPMSVAHADDDEPEPSKVQHVEKILSNGDFYSGQWAYNYPHGHEKYLWTDGCMYVGEWHRGRTSGKGKFSWPSGATYEGDFKSGLMDGKGTHTDSSGDTYKGSLVMNLKYGHGTAKYADGDYYEGEWRRGYQDGQGRYQWKNANHYIGQWRNGIMYGSGTLILNNGNRYDGKWEWGLPRGNGIFRWADGSFYVGVWSQDPKEYSGTYYRSGSKTGTMNWDPQEVFSLEFNDCQICPCETVLMYPSQKMVYSPGVDQKYGSDPSLKQQRVSVDGRFSNYSAESDGSVDRRSREGSEGSANRSPHLRIKHPKKQGVTISKEHKNYELMLNLQLGIRHSVGRPAPSPSLDLKRSAFDPKDKMWTRFPPEGSKHTPPHSSCEFRWKDYCPVVFRTLRKLFKVDPADYMISLCGNALRELSSPGKSGSFFYLTNDDRYMIKTMKNAEVKVFQRMLPAYYNHVPYFENTLVTRFYGLHCVKLSGTVQKKVRFVIMGNLFCSEYSIHRRFDLKGSTHGRTTDKPESKIDATTTLKDLDLNYIFRLQKAWFQAFCKQVDKDCDFLEQEKIMDYSMLVGLHFREVSQSDSIPPSNHTSEVCNPTGDSNVDNASPCLSKVDKDQIPSDPSRLASVRLGIGMPARVELTVRRSDELVGEPTGHMYDVVLYFNIIDILQDYGISKKLEHAYKSFQHDATSISAVDPKQYSRRFRDFISRVFVEDD